MGKLKFKLLLMLLPLLFSMLILVFYIFNEKYEQYKVLDKSSKVIKISMRLSNLIYAIQLERGLSSRYLENHNHLYRNKINEKRKNIDKEFNLLIKSINISLLKMSDEKKIIEETFNNIHAIRNSIDNFDKSTDSFSLYSEIITKYLQVINNFSYNINNTMLVKGYRSHLTLLLLQENAAKERGILSSVLEAKKLDVESYIRINEYTSRFNQLLDMFFATAPLIYQQKMKNYLQEPIVKDVNILIKSVHNKIYKNYFINDLLSSLGFKGMIHNFKNYLIRGNEEILQSVKNDYEKALNIMDKYIQLNQFNDVDKEKILIIKNTIKAYMEMLSTVVKMKNNNKYIPEIDAAVKIDDTPAIDAINYLSENIDNISVDVWWEKSTKRIDLIRNISNEMQNDILKKSSYEKDYIVKNIGIYLIIILIIMALSLILGIVIIRRVVNDLIKTTTMMKEMKNTGNYNYIFELRGADELTDMQDAFNKLIEDRNKAQESEKLAAEVFNNITEGVVVFNAKMEVEAINPSFSAITGYSLAEIQGKHYSMFMSTNNSSYFNLEVKKELSLKGVWEGECNARRKNGEIYPEEANITIITNKNNEPDKYLKVFRDVTSRKRSEKKIFYQANYDHLTGLANRSNGMISLEHELKIAKRNKSMLALMFIDLDGFKKANDTFGHKFGDDILKEVSKRLLACVREVDYVVRIGGDEFIIILPNIQSIKNIKIVAEKIILEASKKYTFNNKECDFISVSIGVSCYPEDALDVESLLNHADKMMYKVKESGKHNYMLYQI